MDEKLKEALAYIIDQMNELRKDLNKVSHVVEDLAAQSKTKLDDKEIISLGKAEFEIRSILKQGKDILESLK